jgi:hypothetical protein
MPGLYEAMLGNFPVGANGANGPGRDFKYLVREEARENHAWSV